MARSNARTAERKGRPEQGRLFIKLLLRLMVAALSYSASMRSNDPLTRGAEVGTKNRDGDLGVFQGSHTVWRGRLHGQQVEVVRYGHCHWSKIIFLRGGREFYRLTIDQKEEYRLGNVRATRREYFDGRLVRQYIGERCCFVEFFELLLRHSSKYPTRDQLAWAAHSRVPRALVGEPRSIRVPRVSWLDRTTADLYIRFYLQCFAPKRRNRTT